MAGTAKFADPQAFVLYCHGNGENVSYLGEYLAGLADRYQINIFAFDYRGYGRSEGTPHEAGILADGDACEDGWLRSEDLAERYCADGAFIGRAVAIDLAAKNGVRFIIQNTFTSLPDAAAFHYPFVPVRWLMRNRYNSLERIASYSGPLLQSHGDRDSVVPFTLGQQLHAAAKGQKQFYVGKGLDHNNGDPEQYREVLGEFLKSLPAITAAPPTSAVNAAGE